MFEQSSFNQDISDWDISQSDGFQAMFYQSQFNQDLCKWGATLTLVENAAPVSEMFQGAACPEKGDPVFGSFPYGPFCYHCVPETSGE